MKIDRVITYFYSILRNNRYALLAMIFQGLIIGIFLQTTWINSNNYDFLNYPAIVIFGFSIIGLIFFWILYAGILSKLYLGDLSRGAIRDILKYDTLSYIPVTITIIIGLAFFNTTTQINYRLGVVLIGIILMVFSKVLLVKYKPPNKEIFLAEKAQQVKIKHVTTITNLDPDKHYANRIQVDSRCPVRKYIVNDELRNAVNLKNIKRGTLKFTPESSDKLRYAVGWNSKEIYPDGNLKLYICKDQKRELIFNKNAAYLLNGWNEYQVDITNNPKTVEITWENSVEGDIYFSLSDIKPIELKKKKNIIVIIFDGVHLNSIGLYQGNLNSDVISNFFRDSLIFTNAYAQGEWTMPNFALMATSLYQSHHGVYDPDLYSKAMPTSHETLAEILQKNGYNTFGYVGHNRVSPGYGHARGYNRFLYRCTYDEFTKRYTEWKRGEHNRDVKISDIRNKENNNKDITLNAIKFLRENKETNNFLFLHYFDTHQPFFQSSDNISSLDDALHNKNIQETLNKSKLQDDDYDFIHELYEQKYREVNDNISLLLDYISRYENEWSTIIFTTDHGNMIFDRDTGSLLSPGKGGRDNYLVDSMMKVPLMIRIPGKTYNKGKFIDDIIEANISIMPTVLDIAGIKPPNNIDGKSVLKTNTKGIFGKGYAIAESCYKDRYELLLKTNDYEYFFKADRDRATNEILPKPRFENFYDTEGKIITQAGKQDELKEEITEILEKNDLSTIMKK